MLSTYWVHSGLLVFGKEKMSKSLGNVVTAHSFLQQYDGEVLRLMCGLLHYRSPVDFSEESILRAEGLLDRLYHCKENGLEKASHAAIPGSGTAEEISKKINEALYDDFNTAKALGFILQAARACFREHNPGVWATWAAACLPVLNSVYGLLAKDPIAARTAIRRQRLTRMGVSEDFSREIDATLAQREAARAAKNFAESDRIRAELEAKGVQVMDGADGATWTVVAKA